MNHESLVHENGPDSWELEYHIGKTQRHSVNLAIFAQENCSDPAARVVLKHTFNLDILQILNHKSRISPRI